MSGNKLLVVFHVPKTAGMTLNYYFRDRLPPGEFVHLGDEKAVRDLAARSERERRKVRIILGHAVGHRTHELIPDKQPVRMVILRDPATRIVSSYNYEMATFYREKGRATISFEQWYSRIERDQMSKWLARRLGVGGLGLRLNLQCSRALHFVGISWPGNEALYQALNQELQTFDYVGCTETLDRDLPSLIAALGFSDLPPRKNVTGNQHKELLQLSEPLKEQLYDRFRLDLRIHRQWLQAKPPTFEAFRGIL